MVEPASRCMPLCAAPPTATPPRRSCNHPRGPRPHAAGDLPLYALNKLPYGKLSGNKIGVQEGVIFLTYSSLTSSSGERALGGGGVECLLAAGQGALPVAGALPLCAQWAGGLL